MRVHLLMLCSYRVRRKRSQESGGGAGGGEGGWELQPFVYAKTVHFNRVSFRGLEDRLQRQRRGLIQNPYLSIYYSLATEVVAMVAVTPTEVRACAFSTWRRSSVRVLHSPVSKISIKSYLKTCKIVFDCLRCSAASVGQERSGTWS